MRFAKPWRCHEKHPETKWRTPLPETREDIQHMHWGNDQSAMNWGTTIP